MRPGQRRSSSFRAYVAISPEAADGRNRTGRRQNPEANGTVFDFFGEASCRPWQQVAQKLLWKFVTANEKLKVLNRDSRDRLILADVRKGNIDSEIVSGKRAGQPTVEALITGGLQK